MRPANRPLSAASSSESGSLACRLSLSAGRPAPARHPSMAGPACSTGWLTHWGELMANTSTDILLKDTQVGWAPPQQRLALNGRVLVAVAAPPAHSRMTQGLPASLGTTWSALTARGHWLQLPGSSKRLRSRRSQPAISQPHLSTLVQVLLEYANSTASLSFYMVHGGTNFGFWAGANVDGNRYLPHITRWGAACELVGAASSCACAELHHGCLRSAVPRTSSLPVTAPCPLQLRLRCPHQRGRRLLPAWHRRPVQVPCENSSLWAPGFP